jgi:hypothetical protein
MSAACSCVDVFMQLQRDVAKLCGPWQVCAVFALCACYCNVVLVDSADTLHATAGFSCNLPCDFPLEPWRAIG